MWDIVAVDDPAINADLAGISTLLGNAPVNLVVSYARKFSEEGWANIQSAAAMTQNMSLAAQALGLGSFWIALADCHEKVRERVGLPQDRMVVAVLALGYPLTRPASGPKRRPLAEVTHYNQYAGEPTPSSSDPGDWLPAQLTTFQRACVVNGRNHNKTRPWEVRALLAALAELSPEHAATPGSTANKRWLDVLPCTGIWTERLSQERPGYTFDIVERSPEVAAFISRRMHRRGVAFTWPAASEGFESPADSVYDRASCLFRLEGLAPAARQDLARDMTRWLKPGGELLLGYVSRHSCHEATERLRRRRGGSLGVEHLLSPEPNFGPFDALLPRDVEQLLETSGLHITGRLGLQALPQADEADFRTRNFAPLSRTIIRSLVHALGWLEYVPGVSARRGRYQFLMATKPE